MSRLTRIASRLSLLFAFTLALVVLPTPAPAHTTANPHVEFASYKAFDDLGWNVRPGVAEQWQFGTAWQEFDAWLGPLPDMHDVVNCTNNPTWACVTVTQYNDPNDVNIIRWDYDGADGTNRTGYVKLNFAHLDANPNDGEGRHYSCKVQAFVFGLHPHTDAATAGGCTLTGDEGDEATIHVGSIVKEVIRDAYRRN